ncbi:hypothetical protein EV714DRAFT_240560, partial [Schizophyllum commune]
ADDIDINDVGVISMRNLRTLRLDNHTSFMLVIICAPHLQQLTLNDFDEYRPGILDLEAMLNRPGAQPMLEELTIARVDSCLPHTSGALLQCLRKLEWLKKLDIDDFSTEMQSLGSAFLFDSLTFRYGAPVLMPALSIFDYRPTPSGMSGETADALQKFMASRRRRRVAGDVVAEAVVVRPTLSIASNSTSLLGVPLADTYCAPVLGTCMPDVLYLLVFLDDETTMTAPNPVQEVTEGTATLHMQGSPEDASGSEQNSAVDQIPSAEHTSQRMSVERAQDDMSLSTAVDGADQETTAGHTGTTVAADAFDDAAARSFLNSVHVDKESEQYKAFRGDTVYGWSHISDWAYAHGCYDTWYKIT